MNYYTGKKDINKVIKTFLNMLKDVGMAGQVTPPLHPFLLQTAILKNPSGMHSLQNHIRYKKDVGMGLLV